MDHIHEEYDGFAQCTYMYNKEAQRFLGHFNSPPHPPLAYSGQPQQELKRDSCLCKVNMVEES